MRKMMALAALIFIVMVTILTRPPTVEIETTYPVMWDIIEVESKGDIHARGELDELGILQIRPIMVQEVNRINKLCGGPQYTLQDRLDPYKSFEMFETYTTYWCTHLDDFSEETIARNWNGGPDGYLENSTEPYWDQILTIKARDTP